MWHQLRRVPQQTLELDLQTFEAPKKELNTATKRGIAFHAGGTRKRGTSWGAFMSQGDMFRKPSEEAQILGDLFAGTEGLRGFNREDVESAAGKKRVVDLISGYLADYIANARAVNTETDDMFGAPPASRAEVLAAQRGRGGKPGEARFSVAMGADAAARREYDEVVARYTNADGSRKPGWMKAPNGKPTSLTERQWVQVRTPAFKRWFGDWERKATADAILGDEDIRSDGRLLAMQGKEQREAAKALYNELRGKGPVETSDGRTVLFTTAGFKEIKSHSADPHTLAIVPILREVIETAHYIGDGETKTVAGGEMKYHFYARRVNLGDGSMVARIVLREDVNGNIFYDEESTSIESIRETANPVTREPNTGRKPQSPHAPHSIAEFFGGINPASVSKVVDANGEPLVVYHGSNWNPLGEKRGDGSFQHDKIRTASEGIGFYFTASKPLASDYGIVGDYFLNLKNPVYAYDKPGLISSEEFYDYIESNGLDIEGDAVNDALDAARTEKLRDGMRRVIDAMRAKGYRFDDNVYGDFISGLSPNTYESMFDYALDAESYVVDGDFDTEAFRDDFRAAERDVFGVDGYRSPNYSGGAGAYVAFTRSQIKSATDNAGVFDPANPDIRFSVAQLPTGEKFVLLDRPNGIDWNDKNKVREYLATLVGTGAVSLVDGKRIEIGNELPDEYTRSKYAEKVFRNVRLRKVRAKAAQHFDELIAVSGERTAEPAKHKNREGGVYYRRNADFAVFGHEVKRGYSAELVTYEENGREYLYDLVGIKDKPSLVPDSATGGNGGFEILSTYNGEGDVPDGTPRIVPQSDPAAQGGAQRFSVGRLYTGSAADYERPSLVHVGTGEGSQVYGWGLYASDRRGIAEEYEHAEAVKRWLRENPTVENRSEMPPMKRGSIYEQTFFTDRAPGDESHLLKWYEPVGEEQLGWILRQAEKEGLVEKFESEKKWKRFNGDFKDFITDDGRSAEAIYERLSESGLAHSDNKYRDTSEFLARAGIDGVKYPADSYGGKGVKDGDEAGWNYVSFRDDNIRVDHKWTDGQLRYSVSKDLQDAMRKREILEGIPVEGRVQPWPENFPKVMLQTTLASIKQKWPELHQRAKAGSDGAAIELVRNILGEERVGKRPNPKWGKLRALAAAHPRAIVVPVIAEERTGRNKIPFVYGYMIQKITGLRLTDKIVQTVRANHTGANAVERMMRRAAFSGAVSCGAEYILVDDHVTQGGTLNELRKYIQSKGGKIVAVTTLTASQFSDTIPVNRDAIQGLYAKFGNNLDEELQQAGIANGVAELTQSQARELRKLRPDTLRDRRDAARVQREREVHSRTARLARQSDSVSGRTDLLPGLKDYFKPDGTPTETGTRWAKARQFQRAIGRELNSIIDEALLAEDLTPEETASLLDRLITSAEATDEIRNGVLPNFRSDSSTDDPSVTLVGPDGRRQFTPERKAVQQQVYDKLMSDTISGANNEALETSADGTAKEEALIVAANEGRPDLPPISLQNPTYETRKDFRIDIIVGPPAAGKSSVFANALSVWYRSRVLDCDACKKGLPGFNDGNGANYVHAESSRLNKRMIYDIQHRAEDDPRRGENIVLPVLGDDVEGLRKKIAEWHAVGYTVYLHNNRVPILHAFGRALLRTLATGRWINPLVIRACQDNPTRAFNEVKKEADYYDQFSNDIPLGEKPVWEDGNYLDPAYGDVKRLDGQGAERGKADGTGATGRLGRTGLVGRPTSRNGQYVLPGFERFSVATPADALFPQLRLMSDDELVTAAVAVRMALGNGGKVSDRAVKVNTVNKLIRRLHPEYKTSDVGRESLRVMSDARKFAKRIRNDLDRGVSESLVLRHLPDTAREQFGREMDEEARRGQRLGRFGQKVAGALEERQARIVEDAVRVQTGMDVSLMENAYGINLSETLMHLAENPLAEKPPAGAGAAGNGEATEDEETADAEGTAAADVGESVKRAVDEIVSVSGQAARAYESNRADRRAADGRDGD